MLTKLHSVTKMFVNVILSLGIYAFEMDIFLNFITKNLLLST